MHVDADDCISSFVEKPKDPPPMPGTAGHGARQHGRLRVRHRRSCSTSSRRDAADPHSSHDFGKDIIPYVVQQRQRGRASFLALLRAHRAAEAASYWRDVGTLDAYWAANIDLTDIVPQLDLYDRNWPIWTFAEISPPAKFVHDQEGRRGQAVSSLVSGGCIVSGATVRQSLLFTNVHMRSYSHVENAVVLPDVEIGRKARLNNVIIDRGVRIPAGLVVGEDPELDAARFRRTDGGICLITQPMIDKLEPMTGIKVLAVASEIYPLVKTGGLADVAGALPRALAQARRRRRSRWCLAIPR